MSVVIAETFKIFAMPVILVPLILSFSRNIMLLFTNRIIFVGGKGGDTV